jgi:opacity protein-like surface antigen
LTKENNIFKIIFIGENLFIWRTKMKKLFLVIFICIGLSLPAWGQNGFSFSIGGGGYIANDFGGGFESSISLFGQSITASLPMPYSGGGGYIFLDATYIEASLGIFFGGGSWETNIDSSLSQYLNIGDIKFTGNFEFTGLDIGLLAKYPIAVTSGIKIFPLLGIDYSIVLSAKLEGVEENDPADWNHLAFKFGAGADFSLTDFLYLRLEALYGVRLASKAEEKYAGDVKNALQSLSSLLGPITPQITSETLLGHGFTAKLALGFRL